MTRHILCKREDFKLFLISIYICNLDVHKVKFVFITNPEISYEWNF